MSQRVNEPVGQKPFQPQRHKGHKGRKRTSLQFQFLPNEAIARSAVQGFASNRLFRVWGSTFGIPVSATSALSAVKQPSLPYSLRSDGRGGDLGLVELCGTRPSNFLRNEAMRSERRFKVPGSTFKAMKLRNEATLEDRRYSKTRTKKDQT